MTTPSLASTAVGLVAATILIGAGSVARAFDRLDRWLDGSDEQLVIFPTYAVEGEEGGLTVPVRAWTFEPEEDSSARDLLVNSLKDALQIDGEEQQERFDRRIRPFLVDNERAQRIDLEIGDTSHRVGTTSADGHTTRRVEISPETAREAIHEKGDRRWIEPTFSTEFGSTEEAIPVIERRGLTVVSDIDDTIKVTDVLDRDEMLRNTFLREFRAVDGMASLYREIADEHAPAFHYLSASPWQLLPFLRTFREDAGFPSGLFHLRSLRVKSISSPIDFVSGSTEYKVSTLEELLEDFPKREFLLVGDSGEHDPEVYGRVASDYSDQIREIWIREVDGADNDASRFEKAFDDLPDEMWTTFDDPGSLALDRSAALSNSDD